MLTQETAARVWQAYREIETAKKLLFDMQEIREQEYQRTLKRPAKHEPTLTDAFGRKQHLQLGIPSGENGHRLLQVAPELGESVIRAHIAKMEAELVGANEQARMELSHVESRVQKGYFCTGCEVSCRLDTCGKPFDITNAYCYMDGNKTGVDWHVMGEQRSV